MAITAFWDPAEEDPELHDLARRAEQAHVEMGSGSGWYRTRSQLRTYFDGLELLAPGWWDWWPASPVWSEPPPGARLVLGGVGYKRPPLRVLHAPTEDDE